MNQVNGSTTGGSPVHSDNPGKEQNTSQENGGVKPIVTSHMTGNSGNGIEGGINNTGGGTHGPRFTGNH